MIPEYIVPMKQGWEIPSRVIYWTKYILELEVRYAFQFETKGKWDRHYLHYKEWDFFLSGQLWEFVNTVRYDAWYHKLIIVERASRQEFRLDYREEVVPPRAVII